MSLVQKQLYNQHSNQQQHHRQYSTSNGRFDMGHGPASSALAATTFGTGYNPLATPSSSSQSGAHASWSSNTSRSPSIWSHEHHGSVQWPVNNRNSQYAPYTDYRRGIPSYTPPHQQPQQSMSHMSVQSSTNLNNTPSQYYNMYGDSTVDTSNQLSNLNTGSNMAYMNQVPHSHQLQHIGSANSLNNLNQANQLNIYGNVGRQITPTSQNTGSNVAPQPYPYQMVAQQPPPPLPNQPLAHQVPGPMTSVMQPNIAGSMSVNTIDGNQLSGAVSMMFGQPDGPVAVPVHQGIQPQMQGQALPLQQQQVHHQNYPVYVPQRMSQAQMAGQMAPNMFTRAPMPHYQPMGSFNELQAPPMEYDLKMSAKFCVAVAAGLFSGSNFGEETESLESFMESLLSATHLSKSTLLMSFVFLSQLNTLDVDIFEGADWKTKIVCSLVLANKMNDDNTFTNASWGSVTDIAPSRITELELAWLDAMDWRMNLNEAGIAEWHYWQSCWDQYERTIQNSYTQSPTSNNMWPTGYVIVPYTMAAAC